MVLDYYRRLLSSSEDQLLTRGNWKRHVFIHKVKQHFYAILIGLATLAVFITIANASFFSPSFFRPSRINLAKQFVSELVDGDVEIEHLEVAEYFEDSKQSSTTKPTTSSPQMSEEEKNKRKNFIYVSKLSKHVTNLSSLFLCFFFISSNIQ